MSDYDRGKYYGKKKFSTPKENFGRTYFGGRNVVASTSSGFKTEKENKETKQDPNARVKTPMILIKREKEQPTEDISQSPKRTKEPEAACSETQNPAPEIKSMTKSVKFLEDSTILTENIQDFLQENNHFLVVGIVGMQGVGKSTILNLLAHDKLTDELKNALFTTETLKEEYGLETFPENDNKPDNIFKIEDDFESNSCATNGIDFFITENRMILLDCQPFISISVLDDLVQSENKRSSIVSEFIPLENSGEIQGLQLTAFLMSVCHILIVVQDWFFDSNVVRFIQTAEMLKPTHSNPEDELIDHFPHLLLIHNKALMEDFTPIKFKTIQEIYEKLFNKSKLGKCTNLGLASNKIIDCYNNVDENIFNVFLIPEYDPSKDTIFNGHPPLELLVKKLRANVLGATKNPLTHIQLTEKTWLQYCVKAWDNVKKSSFFVEYTKLMP